MPTGKVYKVVHYSSFNGDLMSLNTADVLWTRVYQPDVATIPVPGSKLFGFATLEAAVKFLGLQWNMVFPITQIWESKGVNPTKLSWTANRSANFAGFWEEFYNGKEADYICREYAPPGTVVCDSIKLVRRITEVELSLAIRAVA